MEIVRKLDEWMTYPWVLPKAHGRKWVVPLLTEPGIDVNWKARYNYFEMVDGVPALAKDIDENGRFTGKLKSDQEFENGRIYQKIPDFLIGEIYRLPKTTTTDSLELPQGIKPDSLATSPNIPADDKSAVSAAPAAPVSSGTVEISLSGVGDILDSPIDDPVDSVVHTEVSVVETSKTDFSLDLGDISLDSPSILDVSSAPVTPPKPSETNGHTNGHVKVHKPSEPQEMGVFRWTIRAPLSEYTLRRLHAICILAEGQIPLRVISPTGSVIIDDDVGASVDPVKFKLLSEIFGL